MDTACPSNPSSESEELGPDDLESEELGSNEPGSDEFESDERDFDDMNFEEPESDWPESEEAESGVPEQRDSHPIEKATMLSLTFRTKVVSDCFEEFDWLKTIVGKVTYAANTPDAKDIAHACAKLIKRNHIRRTFHEDMEEPSQDTSQLGFDLFDCYGCLKHELIEHCVKKGSGVWGDEVDIGDILLVET
ncbi:MAG: hypothetical protein M1830_002100, partial [Pleopsidium flavum]